MGRETKMKLVRRLICALLFCVISSFILAQQYELQENIPYYTDISDKYIESKCKLDLYYPINSKQFITVVWFHGGGLTSGEKRIPAKLKNQQIAVVTPNYRLSPKVKAAEAIKDAATALAWVFNNIESYGGSAKKIFVSGHSAGGYLTSMIGLDTTYLMDHGIDANSIAGLIPFSGHAITHFTIRSEQGIPGTQALVDEFAPLYHVRSDAPPYIMITGDRELELLGRYEENAYMWRMMKLTGHNQTYLHELDGFGHNMIEPAFPLLLRYVRELSK